METNERGAAGRAPVASGRWSGRILLVCLAAANPAMALHPHVGFTELTQSADVIFVGTVSDVRSRTGATEAAIVTDVTFDVSRLIHESSVVKEDVTKSVTLTFAGGQVGDRGVTVTGVPTFTVGGQYVVFARLDGGSYMNPLIGGTQGLFRVMDDPKTGEAYPVTLSSLGIRSVADGELKYSPKIDRIENGKASLAQPDVVAVPPPKSALGDAEPAWSEQDLDEKQADMPLTLDQFVDQVQGALLMPPPEQPALRGVGPGTPAADAAPRADQKGATHPGAEQGGLRPADGLVPEASLWAPAEDPGAPVGHVSALVNPGAFAKPSAEPAAGDSMLDPLLTGGDKAALCYCGNFNLFLVMEQVPTGWWEWGENNDAMYRYNQFMDIYRYVADDGNWGNNSQNEFSGYPSSQDLINQYGQGWNGELAVTWTFWSGCACCQLTQADVHFNPAYTWWLYLSETLDQPGRILYRPVVAHELGHSWGMQRGSCTEDYSYSQISVMHAYYSNIIEDGYGIHHPEAYSIRQLYSSQTPVINRKDVGVESYYANGPLINSTTDWSFYYTGDPITISNVTVENNSNTATAGVRIRFYLSADNIISTGDYQMGSYWYWDSFPATTYSTGSYATTVPNVPAGTYYVGVIVSTDGDAYNGDDLGFNNATYLHDRITVAQPPPANNSCYSAVPVWLGTLYGTTGGASTDGAASCGTGTPDVWYSFTAPCTGTLTVDSCGSGYDTIVSIHDGCPGSAANELACNDDCPGVPCSFYDSCLAAGVVAGNTYLIRVSGYNGQTGDFVLNIGYGPPGNDDCSLATPVYDGATPYGSCGATTDGPEDCLAGSDVWFHYTSSCTGTLTVSLCGSGYDTYLGVYADGVCPPAPGTALACEDDSVLCGLQSHVTLATTADQTYLIRVGGYQGLSGEGTLTISCGGCALEADCDDGLFCNGQEACVDGACTAGDDPCPGQWCDEDSDFCYAYGNGDFDFDGDVDLVDFNAFQWCVNQYALPYCEPGNLAGDGYVTLDDYAAFESVLTGP